MAAPQLKSGDIVNVILGTAGHIDHGKSTLVKALTGIDPDRLPEEKEREMTIDLGFAPFTLRSGQKVGIIDVPGHERFVKNMVAGATSIDIAMLVVAGDEGPNLQTREHVTIMSLLGLQRGIVVLTKADKAGELLELVKEDVQKLVKGTFLETAPVHTVSSLTGQGMDSLIETINRMVTETPPRRVEGVFRMPIQRVFSVKGFGTVVTGVPVSGRATLGETLEVLPLGKRGRIRHLNAYKAEVTEIRAGHSSAVNLSDIEHGEVRRGMVAAAPDVFRASLFAEARLRYVPDHPKPLKNLTPVKLHVGTAECDGRIVLLDKKQLEPGEEALVQFRLEEPLVTADGDPFIVRLQSPMYTIGGGHILDISTGKVRRFREEVEKRLTEKEEALLDPEAAVEFYLKDCGHRLVDEKAVAAAARAPLELLAAPLKKLRESDRVVKSPSGKFIHRETLETALDLLQRRVADFHSQNPLRAGIETVNLRRLSGFADDEFFSLVLDRLVLDRRLAVENDKVRLASFKVSLSKDDSDAAAEIERILKDARFATPRRDELAERFPRYTKERIDRVIKLLADQGAVAVLKEDVLLHRDTIEEAKRLIEKAVKEAGPLEAAKFRDLVGTTRKYVIPLLEHLDEIGFTKRQGNARVLREKK